VPGRADCKICGGLGWVCENHPEKAWADMIDGRNTATACACGAGMLCACHPDYPIKKRERERA